VISAEAGKASPPTKLKIAKNCNAWIYTFGHNGNGDNALTALSNTTKIANHVNGWGAFFDSNMGFSPPGSIDTQVGLGSEQTFGLNSIVINPYVESGEGTTTPPEATTTPTTDSQNLYYLVGIGTFLMVIFLVDFARRNLAGLTK